MNKPAWTEAIASWSKHIGAEWVRTDQEGLAPYLRNMSGLERDVPAVLLPASTRDVIHIVAAARIHKTPLFPISRGKNWGLGSKLPVRDGCAIVDLSRMNRIHEVNARHAYAVIEPGVTQQQLYEHIETRQLPLLLNVIGSGTETSLIGNALDRGIGYFSSRADTLSGMEVVLGNGRVLSTGFGHYPDSQLTHLYRPGVGPGLDGLLSQSNFGIVTRAGIPLVHRPEAHLAMVSSINDWSRLPAFVDALGHLLRSGILQSVVHIGNRHRSESTMEPLIFEALRDSAGPGTDPEALRREAHELVRRERMGPWSAMIALMGTHRALRAARGEIRRTLRGIARTIFLTEELVKGAQKLGETFRFLPLARRKLALLRGVLPVYGLTRGIPSNEPMKSAAWSLGQIPPSDPGDLDDSDCGMLYCVPLFPMDGETVAEAARGIDRIAARHSFEPAVTLNTINPEVMEAVISIYFDKRLPERVNAAHACVAEMQNWFLAGGLHPYRAGIQLMDGMLDASDPFWQTVRDLKQILDPDHIIAPGRYNLV